MKRYAAIMAVLCLTALTSCHHKDLCYHHPHTANIRIDVDWCEFDKEVPTGMTVIAYDDKGNIAELQHTNTTTHAYMSLEAGMYNTVVYNQSPSEFGSVTFRGMENYSTAEVVAAEVVSRWYTTKDDSEKLVTEPEWIGVGREEACEVTEEMVNGTTQHTIHESRTRAGSEMSYVIAKHFPENIIYTVYVKVHADGIHNLRSARASLGGLAEGYVFHRSGPTGSVVTHLFEQWKITQNTDDPTKGHVTSKVTCFGLPDGHMAQKAENELVFSALLVDNKTVIDFTFNVGDMFRKRIVDGVEQEMEYEIELYLDEVLPDVKPADGSSSGFDAIVEEWGDEIDHDIQM